MQGHKEWAEFDGEPGYVVVGFDAWIPNLAGDDIRVWLYNWSPIDDEPFELFASANGTDYVSLGIVDPANDPYAPNADFNLSAGPLAAARWFRLENGRIDPASDHEGPEIDAFESFHELVPEPATLAFLVGGLAALAARRRRPTPR